MPAVMRKVQSVVISDMRRSEHTLLAQQPDQTLPSSVAGQMVII